MKWNKRRAGDRAVPGAGKPPVPETLSQEAAIPRKRPSPAPGPPRPWMVAEFYPDGYVIVRDHVARKQFKLRFPSGDDLADDLRNLLP